jgi:hypothetical protein
LGPVYHERFDMPAGSRVRDAASNAERPPMLEQTRVRNEARLIERREALSTSEYELIHTDERQRY